jgi:hypothetical protein
VGQGAERPSQITNSSLLRDEAGSSEDGQEAHELDECESDEHLDLKLTDCFWLSSHALKSTISDHPEPDTDAEDCDSDSN